MCLDKFLDVFASHELYIAIVQQLSCFVQFQQSDVPCLLQEWQTDIFGSDEENDGLVLHGLYIRTEDGSQFLNNEGRDVGGLIVQRDCLSGDVHYSLVQLLQFLLPFLYLNIQPRFCVMDLFFYFLLN